MNYQQKPPKGLFLYPKDLKKLTVCTQKVWNSAVKLTGFQLKKGWPLTDEQAFKILLRIRQVQGQIAIGR